MITKIGVALLSVSEGVWEVQEAGYATQEQIDRLCKIRDQMIGTGVDTVVVLSTVNHLQDRGYLHRD